MKDEKVREVFEQVSNKVSRRKFIEQSVKAAFATFAALSLGELARQPVYATSYYCCNPASKGGVMCNTCPSFYNHFHTNCTGGFISCRISNCCPGGNCTGKYCYYATGYWDCVWNFQQGPATIRCSDCFKTSVGCNNPGNATNGPCTCPWLVT